MGYKASGSGAYARILPMYQVERGLCYGISVFLLFRNRFRLFFRNKNEPLFDGSDLVSFHMALESLDGWSNEMGKINH